MNLTFTKVDETNLADVARVFNESRETVVPVEFFRRKFTSPTNTGYIGFLVYDADGTAVCHVGIVPLWVNWNGEKVLCGTFADTVTRPEYRRKGVFRMATEKLHEEAIKEGVKLVFRLPNPTTYNGLVKHLGYSHIDDIYEFTFNVRPLFPLFKFMEKFGLFGLRGFCLRMLCQLSGANRKPFASSVSKQGFHHVVRDSTYMEYKTYSANHILRLAGDWLWFRAEDGIVIGDYETADTERLVRRLKRFCTLTGIHRFRFFVGGRTNEYRILKAMTYPRKDKPVCVYSPDKSMSDVGDFALTFADHDVF